MDPVAKRLKRLHVRVAPALGPEDEADDLVQRFESHVKALRDRIWEEHFPALEQQALDAQAGHIDQLPAKAKPLAAARGFAIDIDPSGRM
jgi:1-acyl-sn-glycerol-3-phosphate acyltransferase